MQKSQKADWQTSIVFNCSTLQVLYSAKVCYLPCSAERAGIGKQCMSPQSSGINGFISRPSFACIFGVRLKGLHTKLVEYRLI